MYCRLKSISRQRCRFRDAREISRDAARRAQAVALARTYALYQAERGRSVNCRVRFVRVTTGSQKYLGVEYVDGTGRRLAGESDGTVAVSVTLNSRRGLCQRYGKLFCTYYSAVCGGQTTKWLNWFSKTQLTPSGQFPVNGVVNRLTIAGRQEVSSR